MTPELRTVCAWCTLPWSRSAFCDKCIPKIGKLARAVAGIALRFTFVAPVTDEDLAHVTEVLQAVLPAGMHARVELRDWPNPTTGLRSPVVELEVWERTRRRWATLSKVQAKPAA